MKNMKNQDGASFPAVVGYIFAILLVLFGIIVVLSLASAQAQNAGGRLFLAIVCFVIGGGLLFAIPKWEARRPMKVEMTQKIDLSGDVAKEELQCENCGADLDKKSVEVKAGAVFINCPYCGATYQITEEPQW
jgi:hypothetical protein